MATAMVLHGLWDSAGALSQGKTVLLFLLFVVMIAAALTIVVRVFRMTVPRERQFLRDILAPEVERGVVTGDELTALSGDRKARKAFRKAAGTHADRKRREYVLEAAADLADALADSHGIDTGRVEFARAEVPESGAVSLRSRPDPPPTNRTAADDWIRHLRRFSVQSYTAINRRTASTAASRR